MGLPIGVISAVNRLSLWDLSAVVRRPDGLGALVVHEGRLRFRRASFGAADPLGWIEVLSGLRPGEDVAVAPGRLADPANEGRRVAPSR